MANPMNAVVDVALKEIERAMTRILPSDCEGAVIVITPKGDVACSSGMDPVKLALALGRLTEDIIKQTKLPILEVHQNGTADKKES